MPEWSNGPHSKCGIRVTVSRVRIPVSPHIYKKGVGNVCAFFLAPAPRCFGRGADKHRSEIPCIIFAPCVQTKCKDFYDSAPRENNLARERQTAVEVSA